MVKRAMKQVPVSSPLHRTLNARQFGLKLIANVTYGYTSASFSGRMPNVHIADAIVQTGRDILQRTIDMVNHHPTWGARVVYGDTDSLFVEVKGRSLAGAFAVGREIARTATDGVPHPMELELEKVYLPCVLCTKKRYVGYMYETEASRPKFDAKGIETVRRDGCPAERKVLEKSLRLLFTTADLSAVKRYVLRQCDKLETGRASLIDCVFASEVKLGMYKSDESAPPGAQVARYREQVDPNDVVQTGERVPYIVIHRQETARLRDSAQRPEVVLFPGPHGGAPQICAPYYILKRILPALDRVFSLMGVDVSSGTAARRAARAPPRPRAAAQRAPPDDRELPQLEQLRALRRAMPRPPLRRVRERPRRGGPAPRASGSWNGGTIRWCATARVLRAALGRRLRVPHPRLPVPLHACQSRTPPGGGDGTRWAACGPARPPRRRAAARVVRCTAAAPAGH